MIEEWRDIEGYEGLYQVSNLGRVKSLERIIEDVNNGRIYTKKEKILKSAKDTHGYYTVCLCKNSKLRTISIHRLVALHFIPNDNPTEKTQVNHKDEDKTNNRVDNLEWCTQVYNLRYGTAIARRAIKQRNGSLSKKVLQMDLNGNVIATYPSLKEIERQMGYCITPIVNCCNGKPKYNTAYNYKWKYA